MDNQKMNNNRPDQDPEDGNNKKDDMNKKSLLVMVVLAIAVMIIAQMLSGKIASASQKEVTYTEFMQDVKDGKVTKVELDSDRIYYEVKNQKNVKYYTGNVQDERLYEELDNAQEQVEQLQVELRRFKTELADVEITADLQVAVDSFLKFADFFFDGLFADWAVLDHINQAQSRVENTKSQIKRVLALLKKMREDVDVQIADEKEKQEQLAVETEL